MYGLETTRALQSRIRRRVAGSFVSAAGGVRVRQARRRLWVSSGHIMRSQLSVPPVPLRVAGESNEFFLTETRNVNE